MATNMDEVRRGQAQPKQLRNICLRFPSPWLYSTGHALEPDLDALDLSSIRVVSAISHTIMYWVVSVLARRGNESIVNDMSRI